MFIGLQIAILSPTQDNRKGESDEAVMTISTIGHQPIQLGGLYSAVQNEFLPGTTSISCPVLNYYELRHESLA